MKHTDRYTYLGLEFHEMLGAYQGVTPEYGRKRRFLNKAFEDSDYPEDGPRIIVRLRRHEPRYTNEDEFVVAVTVPLAEFEKGKKDFFEDSLDEDFVEEYGLSPGLLNDIHDYERRTGVVRPDRYPTEVWELHHEKMRQKMMKKRHLLRRIGAHAHRLDTKVAALVANTMVSGNVTRCAEIMLDTVGQEDFDQELAWIRKAVLGSDRRRRRGACHRLQQDAMPETDVALCSRLRDAEPPKMAASLIDRLKREPTRMSLGPKYDTRNGWTTMAELANELKWPDKRMGKYQQRAKLVKFGHRWRRAELKEACSEGTAVPRYCEYWPNEAKKNRMASYLHRPCPAHLKLGKCLKTKIRLSCWRLETGASHAKCPRCGLAADTAEHVVFECPKVAPEPRKAFLNEMHSLVSWFHVLPPQRQLRWVMAENSPALWDKPLYSFIRSVAEDL